MKLRILLIVILSCLFTSAGCRKQADEVLNPDPRTQIDRPGLFFDDFNYNGVDDSRLSVSGWTARSGGGGPGPAGCSWARSGIGFVDDSSRAGNRLLRLTARTDGSGPGSVQSELYSPVQYQNGTFAARARFSDAPVSGSDGDGVVQTFFTIAPWETAELDIYAEFDFEYLPNGGWGLSGSTLWETSWETVNDRRNTRQSASHADGWHVLVIQADTTETRYYVDDELRATHAAPYVADGLMSVNFNHWFIESELESGISGERSYSYDVDWVIVRKDSMIHTQDIEAIVGEFRDAGIDSYDKVLEE